MYYEKNLKLHTRDGSHGAGIRIIAFESTPLDAKDFLLELNLNFGRKNFIFALRGYYFVTQRIQLERVVWPSWHLNRHRQSLVCNVNFSGILLDILNKDSDSDKWVVLVPFVSRILWNQILVDLSLIWGEIGYSILYISPRYLDNLTWHGVLQESRVQELVLMLVTGTQQAMK